MVHPAPWGKLLIGMTVFSSAILVGVAVLLWRVAREPAGAGIALGGLCLAVLLGGMLFAVRGYRLDGAHLYVQRPLWETDVDLRELESAEIDPGAMQGSWRTFGNGGLFSFSGWYRNKKLGSYRAFVTDFGNAVILRMAHRAVVLSPGDPEAFIEDLLVQNSHLRH